MFTVHNYIYENVKWVCAFIIYCYIFIYINIKIYKSKYEKVGVLPIRIVKSNVSSVGPSSEKFVRVFSLSDEGPTLETSDFIIRIGSTPTFRYFNLYLNTAYAAHYVYKYIHIVISCTSTCKLHR